METVCVLMSTYNGQDYIESQIESILQQKGVDVILLVRDDGSTDQTLDIIKAIAKKNNNIVFQEQKPMGVGQSFIKLLYTAPKADYYAFSDQDDIWHQDKLKTAVDTIKAYKSVKPLLYCCNQMCVDEAGRELYKRFPENYAVPNLIDNVLMNYFAGCTMVMNKELKEKVCKNLPPRTFFNCRIHDAWVSCVANAIGEILYDKTPHMSFRRHEGTFSDAFVEGQSFSLRVKMVRGKIKRLKSRGVMRHGVQKTALYILKYFNTYLDIEEQQCLKTIADYTSGFPAKLRLLNSSIIKNHSKENRIYIIIKILLNVF